MPEPAHWLERIVQAFVGARRVTNRRPCRLSPSASRVLLDPPRGRRAISDRALINFFQITTFGTLEIQSDTRGRA